MPNCEINLRIRFTSDECGQFDQTLNFEIVGTRRRYQLHCRGVCMFPSISREPRIVFNNRKKARESPKEIIQKKYVLADDMFDFGPLLIGNNRDRLIFIYTFIIKDKIFYLYFINYLESEKENF